MIANVKTGLVQPPLAGLKSRRFPFCSRFLFAVRILTVWMPGARGYTRRPIISRASRYGGISNQSSQNGTPRGMSVPRIRSGSRIGSMLS